MTSNEEKIKEIIQWFDFKKIESQMKILNWKWHDTKPPYFPNVDQLKETANKLLEEVFYNNVASISGGGFDVDRLSDGKVKLSFCLETWDE